MERFCCTLEIEDPRPVFCVLLEVAALLRVLESLGSSIAHYSRGNLRSQG